MNLPDGTMEKAVDDGGVLRDVLSEFSDDFYEQCTMGIDLVYYTCDMTLGKKNGKV